MKTCRGCELAKPLDEFGVHRALTDGLQSLCKTCIRNRRATLKAREIDPPVEKVCRACSELLPASAFSRHAQSNDKLQTQCKACSKEFQLSHRYGLTSSEYRRILAEQDGRCAICEVAECSTGRAFAVDHDHACCPSRRSCGRCVRALLCWNCNHTLGVMREDVAVYRRVIAYIEKTRRA